MDERLARGPQAGESYTQTTTSFFQTNEQFFQAFEFLGRDEPYHVLFESGRQGELDIAALRPFAVVEGKNGETSLHRHGSTEMHEGDPLEALAKWMEPYNLPKDPALPPFQGGAVGQISYDYVRYIEHLPELAVDDLRMPDAYFLLYDLFFIHDKKRGKTWVWHLHAEGEEAVKYVEKWKKAWLEAAEKSSGQEHSEAKGTVSAEKSVPSFSGELFGGAVEQIKEYIAAGDVFQVNLSTRQTQLLHTSPFHIYQKLRGLNPSPYMGYMHTPDWQTVSASPELLVKKRGAGVSTRPIAGTRSRGKDEQEDTALEQELMGTEKERAEHVMLVDLERNDLGRVCRYGSVKVDELMEVERYSHVMHIVSNVRGILAETEQVYDMIRAVFPGGTITGAPKVRTMEIIEELEPVRRGFYTGAFGWIGYNKDAELNISIRTMLAKDGYAHVQAGAGIVIDSDPKAEYKESIKKAKALWEAKRQSEAEAGITHEQS